MVTLEIDSDSVRRRAAVQLRSNAVLRGETYVYVVF
jgi:hypothetical protein